VRDFKKTVLGELATRTRAAGLQRCTQTRHEDTRQLGGACWGPIHVEAGTPRGSPETREDSPKASRKKCNFRKKIQLRTPSSAAYGTETATQELASTTTTEVHSQQLAQSHSLTRLQEAHFY